LGSPGIPQIGIPRNFTNWDPQEFHKIGIPRNSTNWDPQEFRKLGSPGIPHIGIPRNSTNWDPQELHKIEQCSKDFENSNIVHNLLISLNILQEFPKICKIQEVYSESSQKLQGIFRIPSEFCQTFQRFSRIYYLKDFQKGF
jgi:hypothetical protein